MPISSGTAWKGSQVTLTGTFSNNGTPGDPTAVTLTVKPPTGAPTVVTSGFVHTNGTGVYAYVFTATQTGRHYVQWLGSGAIVAAVEDYFDVQVSAF